MPEGDIKEMKGKKLVCAECKGKPIKTADTLVIWDKV